MKRRLPYLIAAVVTMILGYSTRMCADSLPKFVADHFGDALWACMIYWGFRAVWVHKKWFWAASFSIIFCFGIELSQLYQAAWINEIRRTVLGGLVLGSGFLSVDLLRYSLGILLAILIDKYFIQKRVSMMI